ncbi:p-hydroxycinnamoyl-CoA synthetase [Kibdelosporangium aridum]|uniref:p-hydroxycinnamoyl-CoA synthetase n=1 Tax=Kibdelosporangium aridum TaxID=2030 RepID=A0A428ZUL2_KIBAR|nr:long-chain fatty acid--CoA ligase [Kibdelosporangium aridum]RSM91737.1 p-hydroxycinnamoyl-CoA synthetase [Kibdelosporangium aridum]
MTNEGLGSWPARRAMMTPDRIAIVYQDRSMTYDEFFTRATRVASRLRASGVAKGDRVAYLGPNHPAFVETMFATHMLGAIFVPLNFRLATPELQYMIADAGIKIIVRDPVTADVTGPEIISLDSYETWLAAGSDEPIDVPVAQDEIAFILYTSGTTGRPKGAMLSHANQIWNTYNVLVSFDVAGDEVSLISAPLFHVAALGQSLLPTFIKGGCSVITPNWDVDMVYDLIERHRVTWMFGVTTMFAGMAQSPRWASADLSSVRCLMSGGAPIPLSLIETYQERGLVFQQGYGLTETSPGATMLEARQSVRKAGSAGVPVFFTSVRVEAPVGEPGEVLIKGPNVTPGYWNNPVATEAAFEDGWFRSGDLAVVDKEGYLYIVDRVKDMFISGGENVYPAEVESVIFGHPSVAEVAVIGVPDPKWGEVGKAFVVCCPDTGLTLAELQEFLASRLAKYKIPVHLEVVTGLPRTGSGKVQKAKLRE